jgi:hypothetical protein
MKLDIYALATVMQLIFKKEQIAPPKRKYIFLD